MAAEASKQNHDAHRVKILLVDDHPMVREQLAKLIRGEPDLTVCGEADGRHEALKVIDTTQPDLAIIDLSLRNSHGLELIKDIHVQYPRLTMLVLSMHEESLHAERTIRAGARGYITKQEATRNIMRAIRRVLGGELYLSEKLAAQIAGRLASHPSPADSTIDQLTDREFRVFEMIGLGHSLRQIADALALDVKTVETHRARIRKKLNLKDSGEVLQHAIRWHQSAGNG